MGKLFAALIIGVLLGWLGPMCSKLPDDLSSIAVPAASSPAPISTPPVAPPPPAAAEERPALIVATYRMKKIFPQTQGKYLIAVRGSNRADVPAVDVMMTLFARRKGTVVERGDSAYPWTLEAGTSSYYSIGVSTGVIDDILAGPEAPGTELAWSLSYRLEGEEPDSRRCFLLRALPRRREPEGIDWRTLGESNECAPEKAAGPSR